VFAPLTTITLVGRVDATAFWPVLRRATARQAPNQADVAVWCAAQGTEPKAAPEKREGARITRFGSVPGQPQAERRRPVND